MNVLMVCTANVSRSFLAEKLMSHEITRRRLKDVRVRSAGVYASPGARPDSKMVAYLEIKGIPVSDHKSRRIHQDDIHWADRILVMEKAHADEIVRQWPGAADKVELLGQYVSMDLSADDVIDPFGRSSFHYRLAQSQITLGVRHFIETRLLSGDDGSDRQP